MTFCSTLADCWLGLCRKSPVVHTFTTVIPTGDVTGNLVQPVAGGTTGRTGRIRGGIAVATESIRALFRQKHLRELSLLFGLVIIFMVLAEHWNLTHVDTAVAATSLISITAGSTSVIIFDTQLFLIEAICISAFVFLLAAVVRYCSTYTTGVVSRFRDSFTGSVGQTRSLAAFSIALAFTAVLLLEISAQNEITGNIESAVDTAMFWLPYAYYFAPDGIFSSLFFSFWMMVDNSILFLVALYVVPFIVLENRRLPAALAGSARLMIRTRYELLGCAVVFGTIVFMAAFGGLLIGQSPALLNHDYDFFLQISRGQVLMTGVCYGILVGCGAIMAFGFTILGVTVTALYGCGAGSGGRSPQEKNRISMECGEGR